MRCFKMKTYQKIYRVTFSWKTKNGYGTMCYREQILFLCKFCKRILEKKGSSQSMGMHKRTLLAYQEVNVMNMKEKILWIKYI